MQGCGGCAHFCEILYNNIFRQFLFILKKVNILISKTQHSKTHTKLISKVLHFPYDKFYHTYNYGFTVCPKYCYSTFVNITYVISNFASKTHPLFCKKPVRSVVFLLVLDVLIVLVGNRIKSRWRSSLKYHPSVFVGGLGHFYNMIF